MNRVPGFLTLLAFLLCLPAANLLVLRWGTHCIPRGPCMVSVAPGLEAPSGVLLVGLALVLRDFVQRELGRAWALAAVAAGVLLSAALAPPTLVLASASAYLVSELADFAAYTAVERHGFLWAVAVSGAVGLVLDSACFLWLAFGSLEHLAGQVVGKGLMLGLALGVLQVLRPRGVPASVR
jgi:uncharacterized PurR-regulated membrane protein YhhQ (DUF165 family)